MPACAACGADNREEARFCDSCGAALGAAPQPREQRKVVTILFADVTGSTALGERLDSESFRRVLARYFEEAKRVVERHGGTVEKFIGDAVMAVFGVPVTHEDDALRAVRAAEELVQVVGQLGPELEAGYGVRLELRVGVNTGEVVTGTEERLATGDAVNVAARLQQGAAPGEILLGGQTLALARDALRVEELEPMELRGKQEPVRVYRLGGVRPGAAGVERRLDAPLVGRAQELRLLGDAFENAVRRRACSLFTLLGTAGVGKSRLVREFVSGADARVVEARCLSYGEGITYWPVVEVVKALGDWRDALAETPSAVAALDALLGEQVRPTTPEETAWAVRKLLEAVAAERPLVVVFDDIHWAEPTFLDLVENIADLSRDAPIMLLCLARPELLDRRAGWGGGKLNAATVLLEPLDALETGELIGQLVDGADLDDDLRDRIRAAAAGNPLFVEEMVAMVRESGARDVTVPPTIRALLAARLDQLPPAERSVLERGAVEGQLFHSDAVAALVSPPGSVERELVGLVRADLVRPDRPQLTVGDAYRFRHLLIRDAAYDALPKASRAELHERFAAWLEGRDLVEHDEIVGYHLEQAYRYRGELGPVDPAAEALAHRAAALLTSSARAAQMRGDKRAAAVLLARAASLTSTGRLRLLPDLSELLFETGELHAALAILDEALVSARERGDAPVAAIAAVLRANVRAHLGEEGRTLEDVVDAGRAAVPVLDREDGRQFLASALGALGVNLFYLGRTREAIEVLDRALELALRDGDLNRARESVRWASAAMAFGPTPVSEIGAYVARLPPALTQLFPQDPSMALLAAHLDAHSGRLAEARANAERARALCRELGIRLYELGSTMFDGIIELRAGDPAAAERALRVGYDGLAELQEKGFRATVATMLAEALVALDRDTEALEVLDVAAQIALPDDCDPQVRMRWVRALVHARRGEVAAARSLAGEAVELARPTGYLVLHGNALLACAEVELMAGAPPAAAAALREALGLFERKEDTVLAARARDRLRALEEPVPD